MLRWLNHYILLIVHCSNFFDGKQSVQVSERKFLNQMHLFSIRSSLDQTYLLFLYLLGPLPLVLSRKLRDVISSDRNLNYSTNLLTPDSYLKVVSSWSSSIPRTIWYPDWPPRRRTTSLKTRPSRGSQWLWVRGIAEDVRCVTSSIRIELNTNNSPVWLNTQ